MKKLRTLWKGQNSFKWLTEFCFKMFKTTTAVEYRKYTHTRNKSSSLFEIYYRSHKGTRFIVIIISHYNSIRSTLSWKFPRSKRKLGPLIFPSATPPHQKNSPKNLFINVTFTYWKCSSTYTSIQAYQMIKRNVWYSYGSNLMIWFPTLHIVTILVNAFLESSHLCLKIFLREYLD